MLGKIGMPREIALRHRLPHFDHLFGSDSYSGLYYSYLWADVMAADGWQAFLEEGGPGTRRWPADSASTFCRTGTASISGSLSPLPWPRSAGERAARRAGTHVTSSSPVPYRRIARLPANAMAALTIMT